MVIDLALVSYGHGRPQNLCNARGILVRLTSWMPAQGLSREHKAQGGKRARDMRMQLA